MLSLIAATAVLTAVLVGTVLALKSSSSSSGATGASASSGDIYHGFTPNPSAVEYTIGRNGGFFIRQGHGGQPLPRTKRRCRAASSSAVASARYSEALAANDVVLEIGRCRIRHVQGGLPAFVELGLPATSLQVVAESL